MTDERKKISDKIILRKAGPEDIAASTLILREAAQQMMDEGKKQWDQSYPTETHVRDDIRKGNGYVLVCNGLIVGYCAIIFDEEHAYKNIQGTWLSNGTYVVVHRMAICKDKKGKGLGRVFLEKVESYALMSGFYSLKVDTNFDNLSMLGLLNNMGFSYCGEISYEKGTRKAFEKILY